MAPLRCFPDVSGEVCKPLPWSKKWDRVTKTFISTKISERHGTLNNLPSPEETTVSANVNNECRITSYTSHGLKHKCREIYSRCSERLTPCRKELTLSRLSHLFTLIDLFFTGKGEQVKLTGKVCETEYIFSYTMCWLCLTFFYGEGEEREVSACGNLCANKHKDQKSPSTTPKLRHLLYKGRSRECKGDKDKRYFCIWGCVKILSCLQSN